MSISSQDIRQRALAAHAAGQTQAQVARSYGVDITTFQRWLRRFRQSGQTAPLARGHRPRALEAGQVRQLDDLVQRTPDATLEQLRDALELRCSLVAVHNALGRLGYRFKKNATGQRTRSRRRQNPA
jgi:transposase